MQTQTIENKLTGKYFPGTNPIVDNGYQGVKSKIQTKGYMEGFNDFLKTPKGKLAIIGTLALALYAATPKKDANALLIDMNSLGAGTSYSMNVINDDSGTSYGALTLDFSGIDPNYLDGVTISLSSTGGNLWGLDSQTSNSAIFLSEGGVDDLAFGDNTVFNFTFPEGYGLSSDVLAKAIAGSDGGPINGTFYTASVPVPEPGTAALLGVGLAGLLLTGKKRKDHIIDGAREAYLKPHPTG